MHPLTHSVYQHPSHTHWLCHSHTHSLSQSLTHSLTHSHTHSLTHTQSLSHSVHPHTHTLWITHLTHVLSYIPCSITHSITHTHTGAVICVVCPTKKTPEDHTSHGSVLKADTMCLVFGGKCVVGIASLPSVPVQCVSYHGSIDIYNLFYVVVLWLWIRFQCHHIPGSRCCILWNTLQLFHTTTNEMQCMLLFLCTLTISHAVISDSIALCKSTAMCYAVPGAFHKSTTRQCNSFSRQATPSQPHRACIRATQIHQYGLYAAICAVWYSWH
jgi:hypothetical protein